MSIRSLALLLALPLGACAALEGGDPDAYSRLSQQDVLIAARLMQQTLENAPDGASRRWTNDATGHTGTITPVKTYVTQNGYFCRDYREEIAFADGQQRFFHTACRTEGDGWVWI